MDPKLLFSPSLISFADVLYPSPLRSMLVLLLRSQLAVSSTTPLPLPLHDVVASASAGGVRLSGGGDGGRPCGVERGAMGRLFSIVGCVLYGGVEKPLLLDSVYAVDATTAANEDRINCSGV